MLYSYWLKEMQFSGNIVQKGGDVIQLKKKKGTKQAFWSKNLRDSHSNAISVWPILIFGVVGVHCFGLNFSCVW